MSSETVSEDQFDHHTELYKMNLKYRHQVFCKSERTLKDYALESQTQEENKEYFNSKYNIKLPTLNPYFYLTV